MHNLPTTQIMTAISTLSKSQRKALRREARRKEAEALAVIPHAERTQLKIVLIVKRKPYSPWALLSCCSDLNYKLQEHRISHAEADREATFRASRWADQGMFAEVRVLWRYGKPMEDRRSERPVNKPKAKHPDTALANKISSLVDSFI